MSTSTPGMALFAQEIAALIANQPDDVSLGDMASVLVAVVRQFIPVVIRGNPANRQTLQVLLQAMLMECLVGPEKGN